MRTLALAVGSSALLVAACGSGSSSTEENVTTDEPGRKVFTLSDGDFVTYPPGTAQKGDKIVCVIEGKRISSPVPPPDVAYSIDPMLVFTRPNGAVRAECGGIHAETAPPGSW